MSFDILSSKQNPFCSHFLEASAGTGKTFAIEHLVARLIIEGEKSFLLDEILIVTFTKAATRELKFRIQKNLKKIYAELLAGSSSIEYVQSICDQGGSKEAIRKIELALLSYESAPIYTLHGFCYRLLKEFALEARITPLLQDPDHTNPKRALEEWVEKELHKEKTLSSYSPVQLQKMLNHHRRRPREWIVSLAKWVWGDQKIERSPSFSEIYNQFCNELATFFPCDKEKVKKDLEALSSCYTKIPKEGLDDLLSLFAEILSSRLLSESQFDTLLAKETILARMKEEHRKKRGEIPSLFYPHLLEALQSKIAPLIELARDPSRLFLNLAAELKKEGKSHFSKGDLFFPDELLHQVKRALDSPLFVEKVRKKFKAAIIDEFQDTDPLQWEIVRTLFSDSILYLVGDPKQSIYAFRNADLSVYLDARQKIDTRCELTTNFRSSPFLVDALNTLFAAALPEWMSQEQVPKVTAGSLISSLKEPAIVWMYAQEKKGRKFPSSLLLHHKLYPYIASEILRLSQDEKIPFEEMAILVKDRFQANEVIQALLHAKIPAHFQRGVPITETEAYFSLKEVMGAVLKPENVRAVKTALATPLLGWSASCLIQSETSNEFLQAKEKFYKLQNTLSMRGFASFFHELMSLSWKEGEKSLLETWWGHELFIHLQKLLSVILQEEEEGIDYLAYLEGLSLRQEGDDPVLQTSFAEETGSIRVMTIHKSKGLEFTVVFALGLASSHPLPEFASLKKENVVTPFSEQDERCQKMLHEIDREKMRLFYVALTRAKKKLYIPLLLDEKNELVPGKSSPVHLFCSYLPGQPVTLLQTLSPHISVHLLQESPFPSYETPARPLPAFNTHSLSFAQRKILSFSSLADPHEIVQVPLLSGLTPSCMPKGAETGVLLHHLFEQIFKRNLHASLCPKALASLIDQELSQTILAPYLPEIPAWLIRLFQKPLHGFSLSDLVSENIQYEAEFLYPCKGGLMKGFADLFFSHGEKYYLLDWKSNLLADYSQEALHLAMKEHQYDLQAAIYREALLRYVKLFDNRPFSSCFGGAIYYFVRGEAFYHFFPEPL